MNFLYKSSVGARYTIVQEDALVSLRDIVSSIEIFNADDRSFPDHRDVTFADVTVEFTRMANGGHDPRPANEHAEDIVQHIMAEFIHALETAQEDAA